MRYRNRGAPFTRDDGSEWERGAVHEPTDNELKRRRYKLRAVVDRAEPSPPSTPPLQVDGEEWPLQMPPDTYIRLHPDGPHKELAQKLVEAAGGSEEEADGSADE